MKLDPWRTPTEWSEVYHNLYSCDRGSQVRGLQMVAMWRARCPRLPLSIECTAELLQACHESGSKDSIISTYSLAIIRFVNGNVDRAQSGAYARSVANVAADIGIPDWMIDIRHDATHKSKPSLFCLRRAASTALVWLEERYWIPQQDLINECQQRVSKCIDKYMQLQKLVLQADADNRKMNKTEITRLIEQITSLSPYEHHLIVENIIQIILQDMSGTSQSKFPVWKPLFTQFDKFKPLIICHLYFELCKYWKTNSDERIGEWLKTIISAGLFGVKCMELYRVFTQLIIKGPNHKMSCDLCCFLLKHCSNLLDPQYKSLYNLLLIYTEPRSNTPENPLEFQIETVSDVLSKVKHKSENKTSQDNKRFIPCDKSGLYDELPLGVLPTDLCPEMVFISTELDLSPVDVTSTEKVDYQSSESVECTMMLENECDFTQHEHFNNSEETFNSLKALKDLQASIKLLDEP